MSQHRIRLGDLILSDGTNPAAAGTDYAYSIQGENFQTGQPEPIDVTIRTFLQDGARVLTQGYGNREVGFILTIEGTDSASLARGEEALAAQMGVRNELGITPHDGWAPESVFDVETSSFGHTADDLLEVRRNERVYSLRFVCQPFVRPDEPDVVEAIPVTTATPVVTTIDAGTATTRWSARIGTLSDQGSFLRVAGTKTPRVSWTGASPFDLTGRHYVSLDVAVFRAGAAPAAITPNLTADGVMVTRVTSIKLLGGYTRHTYYVEANSVASMEFGTEFPEFGYTFDFQTLTASNVPPYTGTGKQSTRTLEVAGSVRTQGTLALTATSGTLDGIMVYTTTASVVSPSLRPYRVSGGTRSVDASAVTGTTENAAAVYEVPVSDLAPGKHQLLVRLKAASTSPISVPYSVRMKTSAGYTGPTVSGTAVITPLATGFGIYAVDNINLPVLAVPDESTALVGLTLGSGSVTFDDWYLANLDEGAVTLVDAGTATRLWLETPTVASPIPAIYTGTQADRSDALGAYASVRSWGKHMFKGDTTIFMVSGGSAAVSSTFSYYRRYFNFVPGRS